MQLLLASHNHHKAIEVRAILADLPFTVLTLHDFPDIDELPETGETFVANALQKARAAHEITGLLCVADDSGIEVDALDGRPGVYSKRYSQEGTDAANNALLISELYGRDDRTARYRCAVAVVGTDWERTGEAACEGTIGFEHRGDGGFGYDPLFWPADAPGRTMAELSMDDKNAISHRGRAFRLLTELLPPTEDDR